MAVTTKILFPATSNSTTTDFSLSGLQLNNQDDLDVYVTKTTAGIAANNNKRILHFRQSTSSNVDANHNQVNNSDGLYFPAITHTGGTETLENYTLVNNNGTVRFNSALPNGAIVFVERRTRDADSAYTSFASGSTIRATDLNNSSTESNFTAQEARNKALTIEGVLFDGDQPSTNFVTTDHIVNGTIVEADLSNSAVTQNKLANNSVGTPELINGSVNSDKILNGTIVNADINASADIAVSKLDHGTARQVLQTNSSGNGVEFTSSVDLPGTFQVRGNAFLDATTNVSGDLTVFNSGTQKFKVTKNNGNTDIEGTLDVAGTAATGALTVTGNIAVSGTVDGRDVAADGNKLDTIDSNATADQTSTDIKGLLQSDKLTLSEINTTSLDSRYYTETESDARYFNVSSGDTITSGDTFPDNDNTIATTKAINARIIDLVDDVGGFVPIANETSFPTSNPDVNNGTGTLVSIKSISSTRTPSSGTVTIANGAGSGNTVSITGCGSTVLTAGFGVIVETTTTLHTYAFHRLVPKATEVTTVATNATAITNVESNLTNINAVANNATNINAVAADATDIGAVAGKATEIGRLGTADAVADMAILGTADVVADMAILGTNDVVADMNTLGTADVVSDMNTLAVTSVINNMDTVAGAVTNVNNVGGSIANVNTTAGSIANVNTVAGSISNVNTVGGAISNVNAVGGSISNVNTVASNISSVNSFANTYRIGANNPTTSLDVGDLFFNTTSNSLKVYTGSAWVDGVTTTGDFALKTGNTFTGSNIYNDNVKALFGTGSDLQIFHDSSNNRNKIESHNSRQLTIHKGNSEIMGIFTPDAGVELHYDNSKKFETTSSGVTVTGGVTSGSGGFTTTSGNVALTADNAEVQLGAGFDFKFSHSGTENVIRGDSPTVFRNAANDETLAKLTPNGSVELYHNNSKKLETTTNGATLTGTLTSTNGTVTHTLGNTLQLTRGSQAISINPNNGGANSFAIINTTAPNGVYFAVSGTNVAVTRADKFEVFKDLRINADNEKLKIGLGDDLELYHDGTNSIIDNNTNDLIIRSDGDDLKLLAEDDIVLRDNDDSTNFIHCVNGGSVDLYHNGTKKFETTSSGVTVTGTTTTGNLTLNSSFPTISLIDSDHNNDYTIINGNGTFRITDSTIGLSRFAIAGDGTASFAKNVDCAEGLDVTGNITVTGTVDGVDIAALNTTVGTKFSKAGGDTITADFTIASGTTNKNINVDVSDRVRFDDNLEATFGNDNNLKIYHTGSHSYIDQTASSGDLYIRQYGTSNSIFFNGANAETFAKFTHNGSCELYHDNNKKIETKSDGVLVTGELQATTLDINGSSHLDGTATVTGNIDMPDNAKVLIGTGDDLELFHNGTDSYIQEVGDGNLKLRTNGNTVQIHQTNGEKLGRFNSNSSVQLYYDNSLKFQTTSNGFEASGGQFQFNGVEGGASQLLIYADEGDDANDKWRVMANTDATFIIGTLADGSWDTAIKAHGNGQVELYYDDSTKFTTTSAGIEVTGRIALMDSSDSAGSGNALWFGAGNDFRIFHDGSSNHIRGTGSHATMFWTSNVERWYIDSNGHYKPAANGNYDIGASNARVRNIYTNDLHLSNKGSSNDVDGSWGDWTIQEGESDLFLKNNRSGKKYKFNLTEVL